MVGTVTEASKPEIGLRKKFVHVAVPPISRWEVLAGSQKRSRSKRRKTNLQQRDNALKIERQQLLRVAYQQSSTNKNVKGRIAGQKALYLNNRNVPKGKPFTLCEVGIEQSKHHM